jgi:DnaJ-domain-containing protein 1
LVECCAVIVDSLAMPDYFSLLNEPRRPWLDADALKEKFLKLSADAHPDRVHNADDATKAAANGHYTTLNAAYQCLREPRERLRHLLELALGAKPSDLTQVPDDLMALFFATGKEFRAADEFLAEKTRTTSPLMQVALFERGQEWVEKLQALRQTIAARRDALHDELKALDAAWDTAQPLARVQEIWRLLSFYERWLAQLQERVVKLSF